MIEPKENPTTSLIEQAKQLKVATEVRIKALLAERDKVTQELRDLGYKPERKKRVATKKATA